MNKVYVRPAGRRDSAFDQRVTLAAFEPYAAMCRKYAEPGVSVLLPYSEGSWSAVGSSCLAWCKKYRPDIRTESRSEHGGVRIRFVASGQQRGASVPHAAGRPSKYRWGGLLVGQSRFYPNGKRATLVASAGQWAMAHGLGWKFSSAKEPGGVRMTRVA